MVLLVNYEFVVNEKFLWDNVMVAWVNHDAFSKKVFINIDLLTF